MMVLYHIIKKGVFIINFLGEPMVPPPNIVPYPSLCGLFMRLFMRLVIHAVIKIFYMTFFLLNFMLYHHHRSLFSLQPISSAR